MSDSVHKRLGDFEIIGEIGRGGMGVVYEARQVSLNRKVALKVLAGSLGLTPRAVERFQREAESAAKLHHTNIVPVYATGQQDGMHFYAMELIDGPSLDRVIKSWENPVPTQPKLQPEDPTAISPHGSPLDVTGTYLPGVPTPGSTIGSSSSGAGVAHFDAIARMVADVADALDHAHKNNVIHRDIKPSNLLLGPDGRLSINDFGLARMLEQPGMTMTGEFVGTPSYMSPEQITAGRIPIDHRTDIYSLGATLYELLTHRSPFIAERRDQMLAQIVQKEPQSPRRINRSIPVDLETICLKALEKDPDRRYQTGKEMADDLRRYLNRFAIAARRTGVLGKAKKWVKRNPWVAGLTVVLVFAALFAGYFAHASWRKEQDRLVAEAEARRKLRDEKLQQTQERILQGNFAGAAEAIAQAIDLGAPSEWADWRRGQIAYHEGRTARAFELLNRAVEKMPDNVAARALLASASVWHQRNERYASEMDALARLTPQTHEDLLYLGLAQSYRNPTMGRETLDAAIRRLPSLVGFVLRAQVGSDEAMDTTDPRLAKLAIQDANSAIRVMGGNPNPAALAMGIFAHLTAAALCDLNDRAGRAELFKLAGDFVKELEALKEERPMPFSILARAWYYLMIGEEQKYLETWEEGIGPEVGLAKGYLTSLYGAGRLSQLLEAVHKTENSPLPADHLLRAWVLVEFPAHRADAVTIFEKNYLAAFPARAQVLERVFFYLWLGRKSDAIRVLEDAQEILKGAPAEHQKKFARLRAFFQDPGANTDAWLAAVHQSRRDSCFAHTLIGHYWLADGDRKKAQHHFQNAVDTGVFYHSEWDLSRVSLARMRHDEKWPRWMNRATEKDKPVGEKP